MTISMDKQYTDEGGTDQWRILCTDAPGAMPVVAVNQLGCVKKFRDDGRCRIDGEPCMGDLIEAKPKVQCDVWVWRSSNGEYDFTTYQDYDFPDCKKVARVTIDVEEGHGLEGGE